MKRNWGRTIEKCVKSRIAVGTVYKVDVLKFYRGQAPRPHNGVLTDVRVGEVRCAVLRGVRRLRSNGRGKEEVAWRSFLLSLSFIGYLLCTFFPILTPEIYACLVLVVLAGRQYCICTTFMDRFHLGGEGA